ncbi:hypothetical protein HKX48_007664 [Thoreauomyces humboldtii]|nr:hypothetical protein HKX48_007664 [Thoreauomyces humboldtii]
MSTHDLESWKEAASEKSSSTSGALRVENMESGTDSSSTWSLPLPSKPRPRQVPKTTGNRAVLAEMKQLREERDDLRRALEGLASVSLDQGSGVSGRVARMLERTRPELPSEVEVEVQINDAQETGTQTEIWTVRTQATCTPAQPAQPTFGAKLTQTPDSPLRLDREKDALIIGQASRERDLGAKLEAALVQISAQQQAAVKLTDAHAADVAATAGAHAAVVRQLEKNLHGIRQQTKADEARMMQVEEQMMQLHTQLQEQLARNTRLKRDLAHVKAAFSAKGVTDAETIGYLKTLVAKALPTLSDPSPKIPPVLPPTPERVEVLTRTVSTSTLDLPNASPVRPTCPPAAQIPFLAAEVSKLSSDLKIAVEALARSEASHRTTRTTLTTLRTTLQALKTQLSESQNAFETLQIAHASQHAAHKATARAHATCRTQLSALKQSNALQIAAHARALAEQQAELTNRHRAHIRRVNAGWEVKLETVRRTHEEPQQTAERASAAIAQVAVSTKSKGPSRYVRLCKALERAVSAWIWAASHRPPLPPPRTPLAELPESPAMLEKLNQISRNVSSRYYLLDGTELIPPRRS